MQTPPLSKFRLLNRDIWVLRDDLLGVFNGNKARKLEWFLQADLSKFDRIVSHGNSQSNAMYSLSLFARMKNLKFDYVTSHICPWLKKNPCGNYAQALSEGMRIFEDKNPKEFATSLLDERAFFVCEGVAQKEAVFGFKTQAHNIYHHAKNLGVKFDIFLPSGTGASAAYLAANTEFNVYTTPCVGDSSYLDELIKTLSPKSNVHIINPPRKFHFAKPCLELYKIWSQISEISDICFDLIYDPIGFATLMENLDIFTNEILYIHQGGILGNASQLERYRVKFGNLMYN